ncbi:hypothetical protein [Streptomyces sp. NPDC060194]|uniref:hypothetical protein n=1 Tax=Streptomyces sp. NPDC060194 TaxID=3347069 RepID=UPI003659D7D5
MTHPRSPLRALRAALFAAVCVALAGTGHSYISGHDIPLHGLAAAFGLAAAGAWCAGGRERGVPAIGAGMLAVQAGLHLLFGGAQQQAHHHAPGEYGAPAMSMETAATGGAGMFTSHLVAGALCTLWLARGEAAFFQLLRALDSFAFTPLRLLLTRAPVPALACPALPAAPARPPLRGVLLAHAVHRRGPPAAARLRRTAPLPS